ncbi:MAG TPA: beta-galactosidase [Armatimonadota bacterium]
MRTRFILIGCCFLLSVLTLAALAAPPTAVDLRGYGRVTAAFTPGQVTFTCERAEKADILLGKLLADLFWDAGTDHQIKTLPVAKRQIPVHSWAPYGWLAVGRAGAVVIAIGAESEGALRTKLAAHGRLLAQGTVFAPTTPYPRYLDFYDLRAYRAYTNAMSSPHGIGLDTHWPFVQQFGLGGLAIQLPAFWSNSPAPGVTEWGAVDAELHAAEAANGLLVSFPTVAGQLPFWMHNQYPEAMMQASPSTLLGDWGGSGMAGGGFQSWGMPLAVQQQTTLRFLRQTVARYKDSPALGGWGICGGAPGMEMGFHGKTTEAWDFSPDGQQEFRRWLREVQGYSLAALSLRWYGAAKTLQTWDDVQAPDPHFFYGNITQDSLWLNHGWQWRKAEQDQRTPPAADAAGWQPVALPPAQEQLFLPYTSAFLRTAFDAGAWLRSHAGQDQYLICHLNLSGWNSKATIWLNGAKLGDFQASDHGRGPFGVKLTGALRPGVNDLCLLIPGEGKVYGSIFLTTSLPQTYPYLSATGNARYTDLLAWQAYEIAEKHRRLFAETRAIDADHPFILSTNELAMSDTVADIAVQYGAGVEMTGREAWYFPWWPSLGLVAGFYGSSEESGTARGEWLDHELGWMMIDGDSSHHLFWTLEDYMKYEKETGWFSKHQRLIQLFGKSLRVKPDIVLLHPAQNMLLDPDDDKWNWDIGRGELQAAHYDNGYATERELDKGIVNGYPVLFDCGTKIMDARLLGAIRRYVEQGGTFVALHNSGVSSPQQPESYPISALTGFKVLGNHSGRLRFGAKPPLFTAWAGREFAGDGRALQPMDPTAIPLATWEDGATAVGYRRLGKGRVIVLGSAFWRTGKDIAGALASRNDMQRAFYECLFADLGVARTANCESPDVWARKFITKNGLQEWLIAYNTTNTPVTTALTLATTAAPATVWNLVDNNAVRFTYDGASVRMPSVTIPAQGVLVFAVKRHDLVDGLATWWGEKVTYWTRRPLPPLPPVAQRAADTAPQALPIERWAFRADPTGVTSAQTAWLQPHYTDTAWTSLRSGLWNQQIPSLKAYRGAGLYRAQFTLPRQWRGHRVLLGLYAWDSPIVYDEGEFYVNGVKITTYQAHGWNQTLTYDVTDALRPGENVLAVKVTHGGKLFAGIAGAVWFAPEPLLQPVVTLSEHWSAVESTGSAAPVLLPFRGKTQHLRCSVTIPQSWQGQRVMLHLEMPMQWLGSVVVNGHPIGYNPFLHPFPLRTDINITPYVRFGAENQLALWPFATLPAKSNAQPQQADAMLTTATIGCERSERNISR